MNELKEKIDNIISKIEKISELFYQQKAQKAYLALQDIIEEILICINELAKYSSEHDNIDLNIKQISIILRNALNAMEQQDTILVADILQHDMINELQKIEMFLK